MSARQKSISRDFRIILVPAELWDDESQAEILDRVAAADRGRKRGDTAGLLLEDVLEGIRNMSPAELRAFLVGLYARRAARIADREEALREGRAA